VLNEAKSYTLQDKLAKSEPM